MKTLNRLSTNVKNVAKKYTGAALTSAALSIPFFANPQNLYAQEQGLSSPIAESQNDVCRYDTSVRQNRICSRNMEFSASGEGIMLKDFVFNLNVTPESRIDLEDLFEFYPQDGGDLSYDIIEIREGLENVGMYLVREFGYTGRDKASVDYIAEMRRNTPANDQHSVRIFDNAVRDHVISPGELYENGRLTIPEGRYLLMVRSETVGTQRENSLPVILDITGEEYVAIIPERPLGEPEGERDLEVIITEELPQCNDGIDNDGDNYIDFPSDPGCLNESDDDETDYIGTPVAYEVPEAEDDGTDLRLIFNLNGGKNDFRIVGGDLGVAYGIVGITANYTRALSESRRELDVPLPLGREANGFDEKSDFSSLGVSLEIRPIPYLLAGAGINSWSQTRRILERIISQEGEDLSVNDRSEIESGISYRFFGGTEIPFSEELRLRIIGGVEIFDDDSHDPAYFIGIGGSVKLN